MNAANPISAIWQGAVRHRRFAPRAHAFSYTLFMLGLDLDEVETLGIGHGRWFGIERAGLLSFYRQDYLKGSSGSLKQAVWQKVAELGGEATPDQRVLLHAGPFFGFKGGRFAEDAVGDADLADVVQPGAHGQHGEFALRQFDLGAQSQRQPDDPLAMFPGATVAFGKGDCQRVVDVFQHDIRRLELNA